MTRSRSFEPESRKCRFFGVGSPHGDDQFGWLVADALRAEDCSLWPVVKLGTPTELLDHLPADPAETSDEQWLFADAAVVGAAPGEWARHDLWQWVRRGDTTAGHSSHGWGLLEAFRLAVELGYRPSRAVVWTIEPVNCQPLAPLSDVVRAGLPQVVEQIRRELRG